MAERVLLPRGVPPRERGSLPSKKKTSRSCDECRRRRVRCDGLRPACSNCSRVHGSRCDYSGQDKRKKNHWTSRVEALEKRNRHLEQLLRNLSCNVPSEAPDKGQQLEGEYTPKQQEHDKKEDKDENEDDDLDLRSQAGPNQLMEIFYNATASHPALASPQPLEDYTGSARLVDMPSRHLAQIALDAFFDCAGVMFYVTPRKQAYDRLDQVYSKQDIPSDDLCELCALAAIGSHYEIEQIPDHVRARFFYIATTGIERLAQASKVQGMRVFICLCMYSVMDKTMNARLLIMSAINIARRILKEHFSEITRDESRLIDYVRTLQTMIFLDGWLSYSLGYQSHVHAAEISLMRVLEIPDQPCLARECPITRSIQVNRTKMTLIASSVYKEMSVHGRLSWHLIDVLSEPLDHWFRTLPQDLHLSAISRRGEVGLTKLHERALYLMHAMFMHTYLLVYCRVIKSQWRAMKNDDDKAGLEKLFASMPDFVLTGYSLYAIQLARTISLVYTQGALMTRCWIAIQASFDAGLILLLNICQNYYTAEQVEMIPQLFERTDTCIGALKFCACRDVAAHRLLNIIRPLYDDVAALTRRPRREREAPKGQSTHPAGVADRMRIGYLTESELSRSTDLAEVACRLLDMLVPHTHQMWV